MKRTLINRYNMNLIERWTYLYPADNFESRSVKRHLITERRKSSWKQRAATELTRKVTRDCSAAIPKIVTL